MNSTSPRIFRLLPCLALLLAALGLFNAAPAQAQSLPALQNVQLTAGDGSLTLTWDSPTSWSTYTTSRYFIIQAKLQTATSWTLIAGATTTDHTTTSQTFTAIGSTALQNGSTYNVRIRSVGINAVSNFQTSAWVEKTGTPQAQQTSTTPVWSATLTPQAFTAGLGGFGCLTKSECDTQLSDNSFTVGETDYHFTSVTDFNIPQGSGDPRLQVYLNAVPNSALQALKFCVGTTEHSISSRLIASRSDPGWSAGTAVSLSIGSSCAQGSTPPTQQSSDATLSGLTAASSTSSTGTFSAFSIGTFASGTTSYTATVANDQTHVKLTPTVTDSEATVKVGKGSSLTTVASGSASGAISLSVGANAITVQVTAEDASTQDYTVTVTRQAQQTTPPQQSSDATLSALTAASSTSSTGTFSAFSIGTFASGTTSYTATVANDQTHVKLTPTANHSSATVGVRKGSTGNFASVTSGSASDAIALDEGANVITVRVTAEDSTTKDYTVTVTRQAAGPVTGGPGGDPEPGARGRAGDAGGDTDQGGRGLHDIFRHRARSGDGDAGHGGPGRPLPAVDCGFVLR